MHSLCSSFVDLKNISISFFHFISPFFFCIETKFASNVKSKQTNIRKNERTDKQTYEERTDGQTNKQKYEITNAQTDKWMKEQNDSFLFEVCAFDGFKGNRFIYLYLQLFKFLLSIRKLKKTYFQFSFII
jgi:hypothetical protein